MKPNNRDENSMNPLFEQTLRLHKKGHPNLKIIEFLKARGYSPKDVDEAMEYLSSYIESGEGVPEAGPEGFEGLPANEPAARPEAIPAEAAEKGVLSDRSVEELVDMILDEKAEAMKEKTSAILKDISSIEQKLNDLGLSSERIREKGDVEEADIMDDFETINSGVSALNDRLSHLEKMIERFSASTTKLLKEVRIGLC